MNGLKNFKTEITQILEKLKLNEVSYESASVELDIATSKLIQAHAIDLPDDIIDEAFDAFSRLQIESAQKNLLSVAEACRIIQERAIDYFEESRGWEAIDIKCKPYWDKLNNNPGNQPKHEI